MARRRNAQSMESRYNESDVTSIKAIQKRSRRRQQRTFKSKSTTSLLTLNQSSDRPKTTSLIKRRTFRNYTNNLKADLNLARFHVHNVKVGRERRHIDKARRERMFQIQMLRERNRRELEAKKQVEKETRQVKLMEEANNNGKDSTNIDDINGKDNMNTGGDDDDDCNSNVRDDDSAIFHMFDDDNDDDEEEEDENAKLELKLLQEQQQRNMSSPLLNMDLIRPCTNSDIGHGTNGSKRKKKQMKYSPVFQDPRFANSPTITSSFKKPYFANLKMSDLAQRELEDMMVKLHQIKQYNKRHPELEHGDSLNEKKMFQQLNRADTMQIMQMKKQYTKNRRRRTVKNVNMQRNSKLINTPLYLLPIAKSNENYQSVFNDFNEAGNVLWEDLERLYSQVSPCRTTVNADGSVLKQTQRMYGESPLPKATNPFLFPKEKSGETIF